MLASNQGQKRKNETIQPNDPTSSDNEHPPAKKGNIMGDMEKPSCPVPRPIKKKTQSSDVVQREETAENSERRTAKKRSSDVADIAPPKDDPKTPVPLAKKAKIDVKGKSKHIPIRRTGKPVSIHVSSVLASSNLETFIELVGSTVVAQKPTNIDVETGSEEDVANEEETTPRPRALDEDVELYETPVVLTPAVRKSRTRKVIVPDDTEVESSDIEEVVRSSVHVHLSVVD